MRTRRRLRRNAFTTTANTSGHSFFAKHGTRIRLIRGRVITVTRARALGISTSNFTPLGQIGTTKMLQFVNAHRRFISPQRHTTDNVGNMLRVRRLLSQTSRRPRVTRRHRRLTSQRIKGRRNRRHYHTGSVSTRLRGRTANTIQHINFPLQNRHMVTRFPNALTRTPRRGPLAITNTRFLGQVRNFNRYLNRP